MEALLSELQANVVCVHSGADALRQLLQREFAVILLDVNMPDMDGFETAELIRRHPRLRRVPIIFMTAGTDDAHALRGYSLGAVDYVITPIVPDVLRTKVQVFVELFRMAEELKQQAEERVVLAREQAGRAAAEEAARRSAFLADAGKNMARSLNLEATARTILDLVVPELADSATLRLQSDGAETIYTSRSSWSRWRVVVWPPLLCSRSVALSAARARRDGGSLARWPRGGASAPCSCPRRPGTPTCGPTSSAAARPEPSCSRASTTRSSAFCLSSSAMRENRRRPAPLSARRPHNRSDHVVDGTQHVSAASGKKRACGHEDDRDAP